jgi:hypothetical protein
MFQTKVAEQIKTHISCSTTFSPENRAVYEIMWKNMVEPDRPQMTIRLTRFACWVTKPPPPSTHAHTHTYSIILTLIAFPRQQWLRERLSILRLYVHYLLLPHIYIFNRVLSELRLAKGYCIVNDYVGHCK